MASILDRWGARLIIHDAVDIVDEPVTNAVNATGIPEERVRWAELARIEYIIVRLLGFEASVRIEVWDSAPNPPVLPEADDAAGSVVDTGRVGLDDLEVQEEIHEERKIWERQGDMKRGYYPTARGKVVWAELPVFPQRHKPSQPPEPPPEQFDKDPDTLRRVWDGLDSL